MPKTTKNGIILLVEDDPNDELLALRGLRAGDMVNEIVVTRDGEEALDYLFGSGMYAGRNTSQAPAVVLLDLKLPKVSGIEVLTRMKGDELTKRIPVVVLTSSDEEQDLKTCYDLGCNSYIRKPVEFAAFQEAVRQLKMYWLLLNERPDSPKT